MRFAAVTACPTGIAHSQMAAENLEQTAQRLGHEIHVEVQGAMGTENELSAADLASVDAVIIAADTAVSRDRFEDIPVVKGTVKDAVNDPEALLEEALAVADADATAATATDVGDADDVGDATAESATSAMDGTPKRGGDREKSIIYRLKQFFS